MSPGPARYSVDRNAGDDSPKWSIKNRYDLKDDRVSGEYVGLESTIGKCAPISMHTKHYQQEGDQTPGPSYLPKPFGSDGRKVTVSPRYRARNYDASPGPGQYSPEQRPFSARYTIKGRNYMPVGSADSPGPACYSPVANATMRSPRQSTIGNRTEPISDKFSTPGPSSYNISRDLGGPKASFHTRPKDRAQMNTPGPGAYNINDQRNSPRYSIGNRTQMKEDINNAGYVSLPSSIGEGPKISLSSRRVYKSTNDTPGPNYMPQGIGNVPAIHVGNRYQPHQPDQTPGPGQYDYTPERGHSFTIKHRNTGPQGGPQSPGPAAYSPNFGQTRRSSPSPTIGIRYPEQKPKESAGYYMLPPINRGPKYTIGLRETCDVCIL